MQSHTNILTKRSYSGRNFTELEMAKNAFHFTSNVWGTFKQLQSVGKKVRAGQHAAAHVFQGFGEFTEKTTDGKYITVSRPLGFAPVFNIAQTI